MIELRKDKIWYDGLDTNPGVDRSWDSVARGLHKFICFGPGDAGASSSGGGGGRNAVPFGQVDEDLDEVPALAGGFGFGSETAPADDDPIDIEFGEPLPGMTATQAVEATSGAPAVGGLAGLSGTDFSPFPSILSFLGKLALAAIPVIGVPLSVASTVLGGLGTLGKAVGSQGLSSLSELSPTSLVSSLFGKGLTSLGVPEDVVGFLSSPPINVNARPTTTDVSIFGIGRGTNNPAVSVPVGTDVITDNVPEDVTQGFSSIKGGISGLVSDVEDFFSQSVEDNPIAVTGGTFDAERATGGLVSLRDNGGPVVSDAQKAYMNWLASVGGPSALSKRGLQKGRIDEVITPAGPEYFSYDQGDVRGAGLYDDFALDYSDFAFAYPENPAFRSLNALGGGPRNIPQSVAPQNIVDVTRQAVIARRLSDEEEERLRRLRRGLPVNVVNAVGAYTGGGIQQLVNQGPTLLDVVNKGMSIPEETIPSQRPQPFIKGQQPGGLRSTNYYTNAMQPASFYAQPQQVRNYGSIY
jgi:hypothetical protein